MPEQSPSANLDASPHAGDCGNGPGWSAGQFGGGEPAYSRTGGPQMLTVDTEGNLYTTEAAVSRIQKFSSEGKPLLQWVNAGSGSGGFGGRPKNLPGPIGITISPQGRIWVTSTNNRVQEFTASGRYLRGIGKQGTEPGEFRTPHGLAFDSRGALYVVDVQNARIQKFAV